MAQAIQLASIHEHQWINLAGLNFTFQTRYRTTLRYRDTQHQIDHTRHTQVIHKQLRESSVSPVQISVPDLLIYPLLFAHQLLIELIVQSQSCDQHIKSIEQNEAKQSNNDAV
jgi:hypothetical protein